MLRTRYYPVSPSCKHGSTRIWSRDWTGTFYADDPTLNSHWATFQSYLPSVMVKIRPDIVDEQAIWPRDIDKVRSIYGNQGFTGSLTRFDVETNDNKFESNFLNGSRDSFLVVFY